MILRGTLLVLFMKCPHVEFERSWHACHDELTPGGRCDGGPTGVGCGVSTSLSVEPSGKLLTVGWDKRPSSNSLIWNKSSRFQTLWHVWSNQTLWDKKNRLVRMYQRNPLYLWFNGIYSAVHVRDTGTVQTLWKTDRDEFSFITTAGINAASFLSLFSFLSTLCLISFILVSCFILPPSVASLYLTLAGQAKIHKNNVRQTRRKNLLGISP